MTVGVRRIKRVDALESGNSIKGANMKRRRRWACRHDESTQSERHKGRLAEPPPVAASVNHSIAADHRPDQMDNAQRRRMALGRAAVAEALPHKCRNIPGGQCMPGAPGTLIDIL